MKVTVAICTWNRADLLDQTLARMCALRIPVGVDWELLVVNNNCTDHTDAVIAKHRPALPIRHIFEPTPGKSHAANRVLDEACGELIAWTDDDVLVDTGWLASIVEAAGRHPEASGFGGPIEPWFPVQPDPTLAEAFSILNAGFCGLDHGKEEGLLLCDEPIFGANMAFRRHALREYRFNPLLGTEAGSSLGGEEIEVVMRMRNRGEMICWVPTMRVRHYVHPSRMTLAYLTRFNEDRGRGVVLLEGVPHGPLICGVPRWLIRRWTEASLASAYYRLMQCRVRSLYWRGQACFLKGMIRQCACSDSQPLHSRGSSLKNAVAREAR